jgi:endonuclease III
MKNATKHAEELRSLFRKLLKDGKPDPMQPMETLKALVRGAMSYDVSDSRASEAMKAIDKEFVGLNELRVATDLEIQELLGTRYPDIEKRVAMITLSLNRIFEKEHTLNLDRMKAVSKRDARQFIRDLPEINPFVEAYVMLFGLEGHAIPVDEEMAEYLRDHEIVDATMSVEEIQRFVEHHIKAEECYDFYCVVRRAAHAGEGKRKAKAK